MKLVALAWLQLCFVSGVLSAAGDLGEACLTTDPKCTPGGSYCVSATSKCACGGNFVQSGTKCVPNYAQPCGASMCPWNNICDANGKCKACGTGYAVRGDRTCGKVAAMPCSIASDCADNMLCRDGSCTCDAVKNFVVNSDGVCECMPNFAGKGDRTCGKVLDQTCTSDAECIDNAICKVVSGNKLCKCDDTKNYAAPASDKSECVCATNYGFRRDGTCGKALDQTCTSDAECIYNAICKDVNGAKSCKCDDTKNYAAPASDKSECLCATNYGFRLDGTCGKKVGQGCTKASDCMSGAVCDLQTTKCVCDATSGYRLAFGSTTSCECMTGYTFNGKACAKTTGATCSSTCSSYASCNATLGYCQCDAGATLNSDTYTCSTGSKAVLTSVLLFLMVHVTSRLT